MKAELAEGDLRQKGGTRAAAGNGMERRGRLGDGLTTRAGQLLTYGLEDEPACRDPLQALGHDLPELAQCPSAAGTGGRAGNDHAPARQVLRERSASGLRSLQSPASRLQIIRRYSPVLYLSFRVELSCALLQVLQS